MDYKQLSPTEVECSVSKEELLTRGIDHKRSTYHTPEVRALFQEIKETVIEKYKIEASNMPLIIEAIPTEDELLVIMSWIDNPSDSLNAHYSTFFDPDSETEVDEDDDFGFASLDSDKKTDNKASLDELQNEIITDIITSLGSGQISETLKKYLNENFLNRLKDAAPSGDLEGILGTLFSDFNAPSGKSSKSALKPDKNDREKMVKRIEKYADAMDLSDKGSQDTSIIEVNFTSIDEVQTTLERIGLTHFQGESILIKEANNSYSLFLKPGPLSLHDFQMETQALSIQSNASFSTNERLMHLLEHLDPIIPKNAINILFGEK